MRHAHREKGGVFEAAVLEAIAAGAKRNDRLVVIIACIGEAERAQNMLGNIIFVSHAAQKLEHMAEDDIAAIVVFELRARRKGERRVAGQRDDLLRRVLEPRGGLEEARNGRIARDAGRMGQQMQQTHVMPGRRRIAIMFADLVVEREFAGLHELQDGGRGELLGERAEPEFALRQMRNVPFAIGQSKPLPQEHLAAGCDQNRAGEKIGRDEAGDELFRRPRKFRWFGQGLPQRGREYVGHQDRRGEAGTIGSPSLPLIAASSAFAQCP